ncbi:MAG TPA: YceI family protein [Bryobacteraceae bacterium]|nr:YceI family protein [Bryobacteraceae bacterium]
MSLAAPFTNASGYKVDRAKSYLLAVTGTSGLFSFAGHRHAVLTKDLSSQISFDPAAFTQSSVTISIPVSSLVIDSAEARRLAGLGEGPSADDVRTIQHRMLGPEVLDAGKFPMIQFTAASVQKTGNSELRLTGQFRMHGQTRQIEVPVRYAESGNGSFEFSGQFTIKQTDYGMQPETAGLGTVHVKDEVQIRFRISMVPDA